MRFLVLLMTAFCCSSFHAVATPADDPPPVSLLGFVKPGMHLGVRFSQQDSFVSLEIFNEDQFRLAHDARAMSLQALGQKYPHVAEQASKSLADYKSSVEARRQQPPNSPSFPPLGEPSVELEVDRAIVLCSVAHVGEDYLLITYGADNSKKQVIAKHAISRIRWTSDELRFRNTIKREETQK